MCLLCTHLYFYLPVCIGTFILYTRILFTRTLIKYGRSSLPAVCLLCGHLDHYSPPSAVVQHCPVISLCRYSPKHHQPSTATFVNLNNFKLTETFFSSIHLDLMLGTGKIVLCKVRGYLNPC